MKKILIFTTAIILFMELLDATILYVCFIPISRAFAIDISSMSLPVVSYMVGTCVLIPIVAWLSRQFNMISIIIVALAAFSISSLACGLSFDLSFFALFRFLQGVSVSVAGTASIAALLSLLENREIVKTMGLINVPALTGTALGPFVGALFSYYLSWRIAFIVNFPIGVGVIVLLRQLKSNPVFNPPKHTMRNSMDWMGYFLILMFLILSSVGFEKLSNKIDMIGCVSVLLGLLFCLGYLSLWKSRRNQESNNSILDLGVFNNANFLFGIIVNLFARTAMCGIPVLLGVVLQHEYGLSVVVVGWYLAVIAGAGIIAKFLSSLIEKIGVCRVIIFSSLMSALVMLLLAKQVYWVGHGYLWIPCFLLGFFTSLLYTSMNSLMYLTLQKNQMANASNIGTIVQQVGICLGVLAAMGGFHLFLSQVNSQAEAFNRCCYFLALVMIVSVLVSIYFEFIYKPKQAYKQNELDLRYE